MIVVKDIIKPFADWQRRTCLQVDRQDGEVKYIQLDIETGLEVRALPEHQFDQRFKPLDDYPPARACQLYSEYSRSMGATEDALTYLRAFTKISDEDFNMALSKKPGSTVIAAAAATARKAAAKPVAKKPAAKKPAAKKPAKAAKAEKTTRAPREDTPSHMFRELIMKGTLTDAQIFAKVQEKYGLDDSRRYYVSWYRHSLRKAGHKVPERKA